MASMHVSHLFLAALLAIISSPVAHAAHCDYQKFTNKEAYANCKDLRVLNTYLHYTYDVQNFTLSTAFIAKPVKPEGWVAWGLNYEGTGMVGSEALIAFKDKGVLIAKTYQLVSNTTIKESNEMSFEVLDMIVETNSFGQFIVYAKLKFPADLPGIYLLWQVGAHVNNGMPMGHSLAMENMSAMDILYFSEPEAPADAPSAEQENAGVGTTRYSGGVTITNNVCFLFLLPFFIASIVI